MRTAILGAGQMGSWLARELSQDNEVGIHDLDKARLQRITDMKILYEPRDIGIFNPELLINAVSLQNTISAFEKVMPHIPKACIISDIASIKGGLPRI